MLQNKPFNINLQLFAEPKVDNPPKVEPKENEPEVKELEVKEIPIVEPKPTITKEDVANMISDTIKNLVPSLIEGLKPKEIETVDPTIPQYVLDLQNELKSIKEEKVNEKTQNFNNKKQIIKSKFNLSDDDFDGIDNEKALLTFERTLDRTILNEKVKFEKDIPDLLKKQGKTISDLNALSDDDKNKKQSNSLYSGFMKSLIR